MSKYTNTGPGARGINVKATKDAQNVSETIWLDPGETKEVDDALIADAKIHDDIKKGDAAAKQAAQAQADADAAAEQPQT